MNLLKLVPIPLFLAITTLLFVVTPIYATTFEVRNNCPYTVWGAAVPGGGRQMNPGDTWVLNINPGTTAARIWARTGCRYTGGSNGLRCNTGDCGGVLQCTGYGQGPNTLAEYALKQWNDLDFFDISLVDGFNVPMSFLPTNGCQGPTCSADINGQCPGQLRSNGGCRNDYNYSYARFFKDRCPRAYSYPQDDATSMFACASGTNYRVTFCP
ncbi:unnamed protein product [Amaranthus hypochondriacus]